LRVASWGADTEGPSRRARKWVLTTYLGGDGVGAVTFGGEGVVGSGRAADSWTVGAGGAVSAGGIGGQPEFAQPGPAAVASLPVEEVRDFF